MPKVNLPSKPSASIVYELSPGDDASSLLVVCLNGLGLPQQFWNPAIEILRESQLSPRPWILTYDRYGQGASDTDPRETWPDREPGYLHTLDDVTDDLHELIQTLSPDRSARLVFASNSIGANIARRYADRYPSVVEGILFLDSNPANADYKTVWPDPEDPSFDLETMTPPGTTLEIYEAAFTRMVNTFSADAKNKEGFDRRQIADILPHPSEPKLRGSKASSKGPWVTVVGHELEKFSNDEAAMMGVPKGMAEMYTDPMWHKYNRGLCELTDPDRAKGPLIAPNAGHFIQKDNPAFVAQELEEIVRKVEGGFEG